MKKQKTNPGKDETIVAYELNLHFKQGDDFRSFLDKAGGDIPKALKGWASFMRRNAANCEKLARAVAKELYAGYRIQVDADTHMIGFCGDEKALERLAKAGLISREAIEA